MKRKEEIGKGNEIKGKEETSQGKGERKVNPKGRHDWLISVYCVGVWKLTNHDFGFTARWRGYERWIG